MARFELCWLVVLHVPDTIVAQQVSVDKALHATVHSTIGLRPRALFQLFFAFLVQICSNTEVPLSHAFSYLCRNHCVESFLWSEVYPIHSKLIQTY